MAPVASNTNGINGSASHHQQTGLPVNPTAVRHEQVESIKVNSPNVKYSEDAITSRYQYQNTHVEKNIKSDGTTEFTATPVNRTYEFKTERKVPKTG